MTGSSARHDPAERPASGDGEAGAATGESTAESSPIPAGITSGVRTLLRDLASSPRPAGSTNEQRAREICSAWLTAHGYAVAEEPFDYSALPGRWGTPVAGVFSLLLLSAVTAAGMTGRPAQALLLVVGAGLAAALAARWVSRQGILTLPLMRCSSTNLVATRGDRPPAVWLMAHLDSKSQPVPIAVRAGGVMGTLGIWAVTLALLAAGVAGFTSPALLWWFVLAMGLLSVIPILASTVGSRSDGALDNASGVAAVLGAAALLAAGSDGTVAIVITSAEELGLAGARAWATGTAPAIALNCDGVDDEGELVAMYSGSRPTAVLQSLASAAAPGEPVRARRLVPGILTDHVALSAAGWSAVTVSRGTTATLRRIHSRSDSLARLRGDGLMPVARLLASSAVSLAMAGEQGVSKTIRKVVDVRGGTS